MRRIVWVRCLLGVLIILNLAMIFFFSGESAEKSGQTSQNVTRPIAATVIQDFESKPQQEQNRIICKMDAPIRKMAHMFEFGLLGLWTVLLIGTWNFPFLSSSGIAVLGVFLCALFDELHQHLAQAGRSARFTDVLIDTSGALLVCLFVGILTHLHRHLQKRKLNRK